MTAAALLSERGLRFPPSFDESAGSTVRVTRTAVGALPIERRKTAPELAVTNTTTVGAAKIDTAVGWLRGALAELSEIRKLTQQWHSCDAAPPNDTAIKTSTQALIELSEVNLRPERISPSTDEAVRISVKSKGKYVGIECYNTGEVLVLAAKDSERPQIWEVNPACLKAAAKELANFFAS